MTTSTSCAIGCHTLSVPCPPDVPDEASPLTAAWRHHVAADETLLRSLERRHREKHRRYHTLSHVDAVVAQAIELATTEDVADLGAIVAAALYHDAVYEPQSRSNERASARLARRDLLALGWAESRVDHVSALIEATATHVDPPDHDHAVLFDADLSILGASPERYAAYVDAVRAEYRHVDDATWSAGRRSVLQGFLDRPAIYATATGVDRWDTAARVNLAGELAALS